MCPVFEIGPMQGLERFSCPSKDGKGYKCIMDHEICDGYYDCPNKEDEDRTMCMFYKAVSTIYINVDQFLSFLISLSLSQSFKLN